MKKMKTLKKLIIVSFMIWGSTILGCTKSNEVVPTTDEMELSNTELKKIIPVGNIISDECLTEFPLEELSEFEIQALYTMREEELLARDIYSQLYDLYAYRAFDQISQSENQHALAIKSLIDRYELEDPAIDHEVGIFTNTALQALYNQLMEMGSISEVEALKVGATIEDVDIYDLQEFLKNGIDNQDMIFVFEKLKSGSENHMRAFIRLLSRKNVEYSPHYITQEEFDLIISLAGNNRQGNKNGNRRNS